MQRYIETELALLPILRQLLAFSPNVALPRCGVTQNRIFVYSAFLYANMRFVGFGRSARYEQPGVYSKYFFSNCRDSCTGSCFWGYSMGTSSSQNFSSNS